MRNYHKSNRPAFVGALLCVFFSAAFAVVLQFFKGDVLDYAIAGDARAALRYALLLAAFILMETALFYVYDRLSARFAVGCLRGLKADIWESVLARSYVAYKARTQGEYLAKYTNEAELIKERHFSMLPMFFEIAFKIVFVSAALFLLDWRIALVTLVLLTTPLYLPKLIEKRLRGAQADYLRAVEENLSKVNDWLSGFEVIKNFSVERGVLQRFRASNDAAMEKLLRDAEVNILARLITTLISYLSYFIILACAAWLVLDSEFSAGDFFVAVGMIDQLSYPLISLSGILRRLVAVRPACLEMEAFINAPFTGEEKRGMRSLKKEIRFENATFSYGDEKPILNGFDLTIEKGKRYLFKGPSGCGKTTAINLLLRYHDVDAGDILLDGVSVSAYSDAYSLFTVVRQEATLFCDTLRNNLAMYREVDDEALIGMLQKLGLSKFANKPALDERIAENGTNLSGGEKKRICLARALLRDTEALLIDEPLANLDSATAERIEDLLLSIENKTLIVVSHQFSENKLSAFDRVVDFSAAAP